MIKIMRPATLLLVSLGMSWAAFAQTKSPAPAATSASAKIDKPKIEAYLRHLELWIPQVTVTVEDPTPAPDMPGYNNLLVHLSYNNATLEVHYFISQDGKRMFKGDSYDLQKSPFQSNLDKLKTDLMPSFGEAGAPVVLAVFGDFECPFCKEEANVLRNNVMTTFPGKVRVYFKDYPLMSIHPWALNAAITGKCVFRQNPETFWKYHDWIYDKQQEITPENLNQKVQEWAGSAGVDALQLGRCVDTKATEPEIQKSIAEGRTLGVEGTPTLFLNGRKLTDQMTQWQTLQQLISMELDHQTKVADAGEKCCTVAVPTLGGK
jgi:protein-disulfide isomerase